MAVNKEELTRMKGRYTERYGQQMDEWTVIFFSEIQEHFQKQNLQIDRSVSEIGKAAQEIKGKSQHVHFSGNWQALFYGAGIVLPVSIAALIISVLVFWYKTTTREFREISEVAQVYENFRDYQFLIEKGKIVRRNGQKFLVLKPLSKGRSFHTGETYIFDAENKQVLVPLGTQ